MAEVVSPWTRYLKRITTYSFGFALALLVTISAAVYIAQFDFFQVGMAWDDAQYVQLARSLAEGRDYVVDTGIGKVQETRYPFGFPLILAPVYALTRGSLQALKLVSLAFTLGCTLLLALGWKALGFRSRIGGLVVAALYGLSPLVVSSSRMVMSESAFAFFALLALILTVRNPAGQRGLALEALALGGCWLFASHTRSIGIVVIASSALYLLFKRKWSRLLWAACGFSAVLVLVVALMSLGWHDTFNIGWYLHELSNRGRWQHTNASIELVPRAIEAARLYAGTYLRDAMLPFAGSPSVQTWLARHGLSILDSLICGLQLLFLVVGYASSVRQRPTPAHSFVALYAIVTILWTFRDVRFLYGILPFLFAYLLAGGGSASEHVVRWLRLPPRSVSRLCALVPGIVLVFIGLQLAASLRLASWNNHTADLSAGTLWIKANTPSDAIVVAERPELIFVYSERATTRLSNDFYSLDELAAEDRSIYVYIGPIVEWSATGELRYSETSEAFVRAAETGVIPCQLVYEDHTARVRVYLLAVRR